MSDTRTLEDHRPGREEGAPAMERYVLPLADPLASLAEVGGKGASLARLAAAGLPVPDGFHVTTQVYRRFVAENELQPRILEALKGVDLSQPAGVDTASQTIGALFAAGRLPPEIADAIVRAYAALPGRDPAVAVRSSATAEDLPEASFAGQQDTYLNVSGADAVLSAVQRCWASLWTARAIGYRSRQGIAPEGVALAVAVQLLVPADAAGILFTADPVGGQRDRAVITATWGLGEAIVGGLVTPDTLTVDKATGRVLQRETAEKQVMTVRVESGTEERPVPEARRRAPVLADRQAAALARLGARIEALYGVPMDIEWALAGGELAIVQARPITALPPQPLEWPLPHPRALLARGSFAEFVPEPASPLFATLAIPISREATLRLMRGMGVTAKDSYLFAVINDYVYIGFVFTLGMTWQLLRASLALTTALFRTSREREAAARAKSLATAQKWQSRPPASLPPSDLLAGAREIFDATAEHYTVAQSGPIPVAMSSEVIFAKFYDLLVKHRGDPEAATFVFGSDNQAVRAEKSLFDLAEWARGRPGLTEALSKAPTEEILGKLDAPPDGTAWDEFRSRFADHLAQYGHAIFGLDFSKPVPADDPTPLVEALKAYLAGSANPYARQRAALERRERAAEAIAKRLDPLRRRWFLKLLKWAQDTAPLREDSIADLGLGYPQLRGMLGELGRRFAVQGAIARADDIYWLEAREADELAAALEQGQPLRNLAGAVDARKARWQAMRRITPPNTLPQKTWLARFLPSAEQTGDTLKGFGASAGRVTAPARVMLGPEDFGRMRAGDVIVAGTTTPAWTPLFARAAGIVTDIGGLLSHSSIVAREYGIPAVLGTGTATKRIHTGQTITVDGSAGTVTL